MPMDLEAGVLYVSEEFGAAAHLCACGCGSKIRTPLGPTEWAFMETAEGPTLYPSIGNWQQPCKSHYWIRNGQVVWAGKLTFEQIKEGRTDEESRRKDYYDNLYSQNDKILQKFWNWIKGLFS